MAVHVQVREIVDHVRVRPTSLDARLGSDSDSATVMDLVADDAAPLEGRVVQSMLERDVERVMARHLRPAESDVLRLRFGLADGRSRTIREVGEGLGIPYATAKQRLFAGLSKMRQPHVSHALRDYLPEDG